MNIKSKVLVLLAIVISIFTLSHLDDNTIEQYTLYSQGGCCHINVKVESSPEIGIKYIINYNDNVLGTSHTEVETREVDADAMIGIFQDHCMMNHQEE
jgi:hypothetical protein